MPMTLRWKLACLSITMALVGGLALGQSADADARRGKTALTTRAFVPAAWTRAAYDDAWKSWQPPRTEKPADYDAAFRDYYGLSKAPYDNAGLPMGLRPAKSIFGRDGIANDCMICHGGAVLDQSIVGLGNASLDLQALFEDLGAASGAPRGLLPFTFSRVRGTTEAGAMAVYLLSFREPNLDVTFERRDLGLRDDLCEDPPAWWLLKKKSTMYHTGTSHARSVRSIMQFMMTPLNGRAVFEREEATFADIQAYLLSLEAPKYPLPIDRSLAEAGKPIFEKTCAKCHGSYGPGGEYPNRIVPIDVVGTDRTRFEGFTRRAGDYYNSTWLAKEKGDAGYKVTHPIGYQAPPLDGVWATAPYFHNGSVPTLEGVLNSNARPKIFTRSYGTGPGDFDDVRVGWKVDVLKQAPDANIPAVLRRKVYDTTQPGRGNQGHTFGDDLDAAARRALIEYLKTL